ncbi:hypothetical protein [Caballeronia sp. LZ035]|uniref:hypothetical protein n=1 Tax=Caballeronia sp. LZ035 TaxID=3038568 RepID=UPI0028595613|nr:hypothetical protein [Caballeronia sp. LZ035]MDR5756959.1 hypothetical protein [Caballeronia sp. LZ035]
MAGSAPPTALVRRRGKWIGCFEQRDTVLTINPDGSFFRKLKSAQQAFDLWCHVYNHERPDPALGTATLISLYRTRLRAYPERRRPIEYGDTDVVVRGGLNGDVRFESQRFKVSSPLSNMHIAFRPCSDIEGSYDLYCAHHRMDTISICLKERGKRS